MGQYRHCAKGCLSCGSPRHLSRRAQGSDCGKRTPMHLARRKISILSGTMRKLTIRPQEQGVLVAPMCDLVKSPRYRSPETARGETLNHPDPRSRRNPPMRGAVGRCGVDQSGSREQLLSMLTRLHSPIMQETLRSGNDRGTSGAVNFLQCGQAPDGISGNRGPEWVA